MALLDYQYSLGGVTFGAGTPYIVGSITGLGLGDKREKMFKNAGADGVEWGREYRDGPVITFEDGLIRFRGPTKDADAYAAMLILRAAFDGKGTGSRVTPRTTKLLGIKMPGQAEATIAGRPGRFDPVLSQLKHGLIPFSATFVAAAPLSV